MKILVWRVLRFPFRLLLVSLTALLHHGRQLTAAGPQWLRSRLSERTPRLVHLPRSYGAVWSGRYPRTCLSFAALLLLSAVVVYFQVVTFGVIDYHTCEVLGGRHWTTETMEHGRDPLPPFSSAKAEVFPSLSLIIRAVYLDPRPRHGHINTTVFLVEIGKHLLANRAIVGCGVGHRVSTHLTIRLAKNSDWVHVHFPDLTHDVAMVDCFDLPVKAGSRAFLWYMRQSSDQPTQLYRVESERPYFIPAPKRTHNEDDVKIVTCIAVVRDFPPYLSEFLRYQKYLGVDHVYMTGEDSFIRNGGFQGDEYVQNALDEGYISFTFWHQWLKNDEIFYHSQMLAHQDCIYRFQGTYDYAYIVDSDDFFIPLVPEEKRLDFYVENYCRFGSCIFPWIEYYPDCGMRWDRLGEHGNVTNTLVSHVATRRLKAGKSIHRLSAILDAGTHKPQVLLDGYHYVFIPPHVAYVAHVRKNREPPGGMEAC